MRIKNRVYIKDDIYISSSKENRKKKRTTKGCALLSHRIFLPYKKHDDDAKKRYQKILCRIILDLDAVVGVEFYRIEQSILFLTFFFSFLLDNLDNYNAIDRRSD